MCTHFTGQHSRPICYCRFQEVVGTKKSKRESIWVRASRFQEVWGTPKGTRESTQTGTVYWGLSEAREVGPLFEESVCEGEMIS